MESFRCAQLSSSLSLARVVDEIQVQDIDRGEQDTCFASCNIAWNKMGEKLSGILKPPSDIIWKIRDLEVKDVQDA